MPFFSNKSIFFSILIFGICNYFLGCTNVEKNECKKTHWATQGFEDGKEGRPSRLSMFLTKCTPYDVTIDNNSYLESYDKGLDQFCSEESAFSRGVQGLKPEGVCEGKTKYKASYDLGVQNFCSQEIGVKHAEEGKSANVFCSSESKYFLGYQQGLKKLCTAENGYKLGFEGKPLPSSCKDKLKIEITKGYQSGRKEFLKKSIKKIQGNINLAEKELTLVKENYTDKLSEAYELPQSTEDPELQKKKDTLDAEIKLLKVKKSELEQKIFEMQKAINEHNAEIGQMMN